MAGSSWDSEGNAMGMFFALQNQTLPLFDPVHRNVGVG